MLAFCELLIIEYAKYEPERANNNQADIHGDIHQVGALGEKTLKIGKHLQATLHEPKAEAYLCRVNFSFWFFF